ncbi:MAG: class I SAM-dependent methyltransferase [bacterium]|nr:class I SAM-dependent methyltransferase [bacterium]
MHPSVRPVPDPVLRADPRDRLNQLCDISDWRGGPMVDALMELGEPVVVHRKAWEYGKMISGLRRLGAVRPDAVGLSVGAGAEHPLFLLANHIERMVATDLYGSEEGWGWGRDFMADPARYAPFPFREGHLEVHDMSGLDLAFPDATFDLVYTLSSIEHFGGHEAAAQAMREMSRVTKPGGIVCVVTELLLSRATAPELFTFPDLQRYLIEGSDLRLADPVVDLRISESLLLHPEHMIKEGDRVSPHIVVTGWGETDAVWTSVILFFRR